MQKEQRVQQLFQVDPKQTFPEKEDCFGRTGEQRRGEQQRGRNWRTRKKKPSRWEGRMRPLSQAVRMSWRQMFVRRHPLPSFCLDPFHHDSSHKPCRLREKGLIMVNSSGEEKLQ